MPFISLEAVQSNLLSPMVLSFYLGVLAVFLKSDLKLPGNMYEGLSLYLLLALGLKGGMYLSQTNLSLLVLPVFVTLSLGMILPLIAFSIARGLGKLSRPDSAALAAHYGSVSIVTFIATQVYVEGLGHKGEGFMPALVTLLEVPGIVIALLLAQKKGSKQEVLIAEKPGTLGQRIYTLLVSKSILVLLGGLLIGTISGPQGIKPIEPFFITPFQGALVLFMLDLGLVAGQRLGDLRHIKGFMTFYAIIVPLINGTIGVLGGTLIGLSVGGAAILGAMAASASYIAAPAAVRVFIPEANPAYYITSSLVITFPFNLSLGIPLYFELSLWASKFFGS